MKGHEAAIVEAKKALKAIKPIRERIGWRAKERLTAIRGRIKRNEPLIENDVQYLKSLLRVYTHPNWERITNGEINTAYSHLKSRCS